MSAPKLSEALCLIYERLSTYAPLLALVPVEQITNHRPQVSEGLNKNPAVLFRIETAPEWDTKDSNGYEATITVDVWSRQHGDSEVLEIMEAVYSALHLYEIPLTSGQNLLTRHRDTRTFVEDGVTHHGIITLTHILTT